MFLAYDTETGATTSDCSLLTAYFAVVDPITFQILDDIHFKLKPDDGRYIVKAAALKVNGIDLCTHDSSAIPYRRASEFLELFLARHSSPGDLLKPVGHKVAFDEDFIHTYLMPKASWEKYVCYRTLDTQVIGTYLKQKGVIPPNIGGSLQSLGKHYGLPTDGVHDAEFDTKLCVQVLKKMLL